MSLADAIRFIQLAERDPGLREQIAHHAENTRLEHLLEIGAGAGCKFTADELRRAFVMDWDIRRRYYMPKKPS